MQDRRLAIVLLSGGLDSATVLAIARHEGFTPMALSFRYGQRHAVELDAATRVANACGAREHLVVEIDLRTFGGSALTADIAVPKDGSSLAPSAAIASSAAIAQSAPHDDPHVFHDNPSVPQGQPSQNTPSTAGPIVPITYVPARNTIFLAYALALAEVRESQDLFIGVNAVDYSGYPDCRPEYIAAFQRMAALATRAGVSGRPVRIHTPLMHWRKEQIIRRGLELGVDYGLTRSCYDPDASGAGCGLCDSCRLRLAAFAQLGIPDPAPYSRAAGVQDR